MYVEILWKRGEIVPEEQFLLLSTIFCYLMLDFYVKTRISFSLRDKQLFEITKVEMTRVDCRCGLYLSQQTAPVLKVCQRIYKLYYLQAQMVATFMRTAIAKVLDMIYELLLGKFIIKYIALSFSSCLSINFAVFKYGITNNDIMDGISTNVPLWVN